jgi:hypothetical protein
MLIQVYRIGVMPLPIPLALSLSKGAFRRSES